MFADAAIRCMADEVLLALTGEHAVISVVTLRTYLIALSSDPARGAATDSVVEPTFASVEALAVLRTVDAPGAVTAGLGTRETHPARQTLALSCDVMAVSTVLAGALLGTLLAVGAETTGVLAGGASVAWPA